MKNQRNLGGAVVSKNILEGYGRLKWCVRENSINDIDNGWRFFSENDTEEYLAESANLTICAWETVVKFEPFIDSIFDLPIGTELTLCNENNKKYFIDTKTGKALVS
ncbi:immunity protein Imm33 domain-containing protein [Treponema bryantii]|uniref:immunity protein Imm33 domain-containing protein n=1 Tax=Treponema bryantii TaxID=163 RepID=UPI002B2B548E|nr:hypothetical protein TRBR_28730 [Treponema bryantii]